MKSISVFLCVFFAVSTWAQVSRVAGAVEGSVADSSSAAIAGASVTVTNTDTNQSRTAVSDERGMYRFGELMVGTYQLRATHAGFADYLHPDLAVAVGQTLFVPVTLRPSGSTESITVTDAPSVIDTSQTTLTTNVDSERIEELPVQSRNYLNFVLLAPGVAPSSAGTRSPAGGSVASDSGFSFGGLRGSSNSVSIDGLDNNDEYSGASRTELSLEIVREFQVVNNGLSAEFGGASGGAINVVTKTGANTIHGDAFLFLQNGALNAREPVADAEQSPDLNRYRAGFAIGGPIRKSRTFVYAAVEQEHSRGTESPEINDVAQINSVLTSPLLSTNPFPVTRAETEASAKLTHQLSNCNSLMLRYAFTNNREAGDAFNNSSLFDYSARGSSFVKDHAGVGALTSVISPDFLNDVRFQIASREVVTRTTDGSGPGVDIAGIAIFGRPYSGNGSRQENHYELSDTVSIAHGRHLLKAGGTVNHVNLDANIADGFGGQFTFASLADFVAGAPREYRQVFGDPRTAFGVTALGGFLQDTWTARPGLTFTLGARYDFEHLPATFHQDTNNVSPRLGVAWAPISGWAVRAGYGIFFDRYLLAPLNFALQRNGTNAFEQVLFDNAAQEVWASPSQSLTAPSAVAPSIYRAQTDLATPYSQQANFAIEHQVAENTSVTATYLFVRGVKLSRTLNSNLVPPVLLTPANAAALGFASPTPQQLGRMVFSPVRRNPGFDAVYELQDESNSTYHGLSLALNHRLANEIAFAGSYTFSKAVDDASSFEEQPQNPYDLHAERGYSANDQRHRFVFSGVFDLPIGDEDDGKPGTQDDLVTKIFRNIELAPIFSVGSGRPVNPLVGFDALHSLAYPASARPQGYARNNFRTGTTNTLDFRIVRYFDIPPHGKLDFVAEVFNAFNHRNILGLNPVFGPGSAATANFLQPIAAERPRQLQFSIDFEF